MSILKECFLKSFHPFNNVANEVIPTTTKLSFHMDATTTLTAMINKASPLKKALHFLKSEASSIWATVLLVPYTLSFMEDRPYLSV